MTDHEAYLCQSMELHTRSKVDASCDLKPASSYKHFMEDNSNLRAQQGRLKTGTGTKGCHYIGKCYYHLVEVELTLAPRDGIAKDLCA